MSRKVLVVLTSTEKYPNLNRATGIWLGEAVHFVAEIEQAGLAVDYVSPLGGYTPIDPHSLAMAEAIDWEWYRKRSFMDRLGTALTPGQVNPAEYAAIYYVGGHGVMWDFPDNRELQEVSRKIYEAGGYVASVCHGVAGLLNVRLSDGSYLIADKRLTGFSNEEERLVELEKYVPFMTEDELVKRGARFEKAAAPWQAFAVSDQRVITGQNPASGAAVAQLLLKEMV